MLVGISIATSASVAVGAGLLGGTVTGVVVFALLRSVGRGEQRRLLTLSVHQRLLQARSFQHDTLVALQDTLGEYLVAANRSLLARDKMLLRRDEWSATPLDPCLADDLYRADVRSSLLIGRVDDDELQSAVEVLRAMCAQIAAGDRDTAVAAAGHIGAQWSVVNGRLGQLIRESGPFGPAA